jgi:flagellar assembly factor FliW
MTLATPDLFETTSVASAVLGDVPVRADQILTFELGLLGLGNERQWMLVATEREGFAWLQSVNEPALCFLLVDPYAVAPAYTLDVPAFIQTALQLRADDAPLVQAIVTLPTAPDGVPTANLQGPIVINPRTRRGAQVVLAEPTHGVAVPLTGL